MTCQQKNIDRHPRKAARLDSGVCGPPFFRPSPLSSQAARGLQDDHRGTDAPPAGHDLIWRLLCGCLAIVVWGVIFIACLVAAPLALVIAESGRRNGTDQ